ncbi:ribonucleoside-diphosphate reductase beta subunit [Crocosphaera subtropica ATCC 51142]|uniref:Ribonucleoside-diphosphate reductase subunit beta n=1 Tax=Crocosphaera subtropica (strain ATCC 51142 / BH68) TaxID=43989 RepID=B1X263_CROS5|nr:ribonucleotide-diphosphate reductase subunit beta [Crocosphaera subtropica]ACB54224.1 ribonucleoside-diphosphate reductase beta subunit [Crocosphaera subtropica ATCC 51142]
MTFTEIKPSPIFNPTGKDNKEKRHLWGGDTTNVINLNETRYGWARTIYQTMREGYWIPQRTDLSQDKLDYVNLIPGERRALKGILSYLNFLDSVQVANIPELSRYITAPEARMCLAEQTSQEAMHGETYQYITESIIPENEQHEVYDFWKKDLLLNERCEFIASYYQTLADNPCGETYFMALIGDYLLEGLLFYQGFLFFYNLASSQRLAGCAKLIKQINMDELTHVSLYQKLITEAKTKFSYSEDEITELFVNTVEKEIEWTNHIFDGQILGVSEASTEAYTKYLANLRLKAIGISAIYPEVENPYAHLDWADFKGIGKSKAAFFETEVTGYAQPTAVKGWEKLRV